MQAVIHNLADLPRDRWVRCGLGKSAAEAAGLGAEAVFVCPDGRRFRAVQGRDMRDHTRIYRVLANFHAGERIEGKLEPHTPDEAVPGFTAHPWVRDDIAELIPHVTVRRGGQDYTTGSALELTVVDESPAHQRWYLRSEIADLGMVLEWWVEFGTLDPVADCWGRLVWSDRSDPSESTRVDGVILTTGELYVDHFAKAKGMGEPFASGRDWVLPVSGARNFVDGTGLDFAGQMLCFVSDPAQVPEDLDLEADTGWVSWSIRSLEAARTAMPVVGSGTHWDGQLLATKNVPRVSSDGLANMVGEFAREWSRFLDTLDRRGDFYDRRRFGCTKTPSQTGSQEDFGAVKGSFVWVLGEPAALHMLAYAAYADVYRPGMALFEGGQPLDPDGHPEWKTWSGYTHYARSQSPDRLGKDWQAWPSIGATSYSNYDDQHRSQNNLCAVLAATDDPLAMAIVNSASVVDAAMLDNRVGATRAPGRLFGTWSQFAVLLEDGVPRDRFIARVDEKLGALSRLSHLNASGPIKVISSSGPDGRKQVYYPDGHAQAGQLARFWVIWEHGLFAVGCYNLWKATGDERALAMLKVICETIVARALFQQDAQWFLCDDMVWLDDGEALNRSLVRYDPSPNKPAVNVGPGIGGVTSWGFCSVLVATEVLDEGPLRDKALQAVRFFTGGREANKRTTAEWWACVASAVV